MFLFVDLTALSTIFHSKNYLIPLDIDGLYSWNNLLNENLYIASHLSYTFISNL